MTEDTIVHHPDRQVSDEEQRLWEELKVELERVSFEHISVTQVATERVGIHQTRSRQIVSTWQNEGLVASGAAGSYDSAALTEYGRQVRSIEEE